MTEMLPGGLVEHLGEAIRLNRGRRAAYVAVGGARASFLSRTLVAAEAALLPVAWLLDRQARPFVEVGVPILVSELTGFAGLPAPSGSVSQQAPPCTPVADGSVRGATAYVRRRDYGRAATEIARVLLAERVRRGRPIPVTAHVLESAGLMAARGADYARQTDGATAPLTARLVVGHLALVPLARALDRWAAPLYRRGVGLFVNDLPAIPFDADAHARQRNDR